MVPSLMVPGRLQDEMYMSRLPTGVRPETDVDLIGLQDGLNGGGHPPQQGT